MTYLSSEPFCITYKANKCSSAFFFCFCVWVFIMIGPFFLAIVTSNFWPTNNFYYEQPVLRMRNDFVLFVTSDKDFKYYSNLNSLDIQNNNELSPILKVQNYDLNNDHYWDKISIDLAFVGGNSVKKIDFFILFDYGFRDKARMQMQSFAHFSLSSSNSINKAYLFGEMKFMQRDALESNTFTYNVYNKSIFEENNVDFKEILIANLKRNHIVFFDEKHNYVSGGSSFTSSEININIKIPTYQEIRYVPTLIDSWKEAWTQYISLFFPIYLFLTTLMIYIFQKRIIQTEQIFN